MKLNRIFFITLILVFFGIIAVSAVSAIDASYIHSDIKGPIGSDDGISGDYTIKSTNIQIGKDFKYNKKTLNKKEYKKAEKKIKNKIKINKYHLKLSKQDSNLIKYNSKNYDYTIMKLDKGKMYIPKFKSIDKKTKKFIGFKKINDDLVINFMFHKNADNQAGRAGLIVGTFLNKFERY